MISIIVPVYKVEKYIHRCIDSILAQTYTNIEVILVDDGSPDNCPTICDEYAKKDKRVKVLHKKNGGLSSARNAGIDIAKGEYIGFIDSDDYIAPDMYEKLHDAIKTANAEMAVCNYAWINEDGSQNELDLSYDKITTRVLNRNEAFAELFNRGNVAYVTAVNKLYKYSLLNAIRFPEGKIHEDEFTIHHFIDKCDHVACISDTLYFYIKREGSITGKFNAKRFDAAAALLDRCNFFKKRGNNVYAARTLYNIFFWLIFTFKKVKRLNEYERWFLFICKCVFLMFTSPQILFFFTRKLQSKTSVYIRRNLAWRKIKKAVLKSKKNNRRVFLVATPEHGNLGDSAIVYAERQIIRRKYAKRNIIEIPNSLYLYYRDSIQKLVKPNDLIVIDGGGNLGTLWIEEDDKITDIIDRYKNNKIIVFPQTCYYDDNSEARLKRNKAIYESAPQLTITLRDRASYNFAMDNFNSVSCAYIPDVVLSITDVPKKDKRNGVLLCFRKDREKIIGDDAIVDIRNHLNDNNITFSETDTIITRSVSARNRKKEIYSKWSEFGGAELVITDRLHGMIFAAITGTPCIAVDNVSKKVSGVYEWIKDLQYIRVLDKHDDIIPNISDMCSKTGYEYTFTYPDFFDRVI